MYSIDIYRTDDAILIHDKPGGWKRALPGLIAGLAPVYFLLFFATLIYFDPPGQNAIPPAAEPRELAWTEIGLILFGIFILAPAFGFMVFSFALVFLLSLWRINGHETLLIDRDSIRHDWWCFWGRRSRIYPRPEKIKTETHPGPGNFLVGGSFCAIIRFRKRWWQVQHMYLPTAAERHWLFTELARFQSEVPATLPIDDKRPVRRGSFSESESGMNVLQTLDWRGKYFQRVVPKSESVSEAPLQRGKPGILSLRCAKCHKIVPREQVLPDKPLAHCPDCGCIFEPQEMKRGEWLPKSRLQIHRDTDSLEITQKPLRTGLPLWTILLFVLFDIGLIAVYFYIQQLFPDENVFEMIRPEDAGEILYFFVITHLIILPLPLWAFFDRRTIRLNRETLTITGRWLFIPWKRTVSRLQVQKASFGELHSLFYNLKLVYGQRNVVWIGCMTWEEIETLRGEINHFLYTVEPVRFENASDNGEPAFRGGTDRGGTDRGGTDLGGTESFDPEIGLHCPDCGAKFSSDSLDFPTGNAHCPSCNTTFPIDHAVAYRIEVIADKQPESIAVERMDDSLTMRYLPDSEKGLRYTNIVACYICLTMFIGGLAMSIGMLIFMWIPNEMLNLGMNVVIVLLLGPMVVFLSVAYMQDLKNFYCDWTIHLDKHEARFELRCKKHHQTMVIPREKIIEARINRDTGGFKKIRFGSIPEFLWCRKGVGGHFLLDDGTQHYLPLGSVDERKVRKVTHWMLATLNGFLAAHPAEPQP